MKGTRARFIQLLRSSESVRFRGWWHPEWGERPILKVRSADVLIGHPSKLDSDGNPTASYLPFPKADEIEPVGEYGFRLVNDGGYFLEYEFTPQGEEVSRG